MQHALHRQVLRRKLEDHLAQVQRVGCRLRLVPTAQQLRRVQKEELEVAGGAVVGGCAARQSDLCGQ